jgi:hypothetical protein
MCNSESASKPDDGMVIAPRPRCFSVLCAPKSYAEAAFEVRTPQIVDAQQHVDCGVLDTGG